ncbi:MAG TPA: OmpA family protein [Gemmatimonadaceae bacterium]|jgi:outer membrane protein OmpA-like peptidoglycan-associated protein
MRFHTRPLAFTAAFFLLGGCATSGALRRATATQQAALAQQQQALASERADRVASDSALRQELGLVRGDVQSLRTDLEAMRTDFGAKITAMADGLKFDMPVNFAYDNATVNDQDHATLDRFAKVVQQYYPGTKVTVEGFADPAGTVNYNLALSKRRAEGVRQYLVSQGLTTDQVATVGYGKTRLVVPGAWGDKPGAELNRRVVFVIETKPGGVVSSN